MGSRQGSNQHVSKKLQGDRTEAKAGTQTREIVAKKAGFSSATQYERTAFVEDHGAPNVVAAMNKGELSISAAAEVVNAHPGAGDPPRRRAAEDLGRPGR